MHNLNTIIARNARASRWATQLEAETYAREHLLAWVAVPTCAGDWRLVPTAEAPEARMPDAPDPEPEPTGSFAQELRDHVALYASQVAAGRQLSDLELFSLTMAQRLLILHQVPAIFWDDTPHYQTRTAR